MSGSCVRRMWSSRRTSVDEESGESKETLINVPMADTVVQSHDVLLLIGDDDAVSEFPTK